MPSLTSPAKKSRKQELEDTMLQAQAQLEELTEEQPIIEDNENGPDTEEQEPDENSETEESNEPKPLRYPDIEIIPCWTGEIKVGADADGQPIMVKGVGPITEDMAKEFLGWVTEAEFIKSSLEANPQFKEEELKATVDEKHLLTDLEGNRIICWNNQHNRYFNQKVTNKYKQDFLQGHWAGPTTFPGETVNCESLVIDRTGEVLSGQKRLAGFILACQAWRLQTALWRDIWPDGPPVFETVVWLGCSNNPRIVQTIDNIDPRSRMDIFYTTGQFPEITNRVQRRDINRYLDHAVDMLRERSGAVLIDRASKHLTHSLALDFVERHERIKECVRLMWKLNKGADKGDHPINKFKLYAGHAAAVCYLMGASNSERDRYVSGAKGLSEERAKEYQPNESSIKWTNWKKAVEFWNNLVNDKVQGFASFKPVREALMDLIDPDNLHQCGLVEKFEVLARAWERFVADEPITLHDIKIKHILRGDEGAKLDLGDYVVVNDKTKLAETHKFGGIDIGKAKTTPKKQTQTDKDATDEGATDAEAEEAMRAATAKKNFEEMRAKVEGRNKATGSGQASGGNHSSGGPATTPTMSKLDQLAAQAASKTKPVKPSKPKLRGGIGD